MTGGNGGHYVGFWGTTGGFGGSYVANSPLYCRWFRFFGRFSPPFSDNLRSSTNWSRDSHDDTGSCAGFGGTGQAPSPGHGFASRGSGGLRRRGPARCAGLSGGRRQGAAGERTKLRNEREHNIRKRGRASSSGVEFDEAGQFCVRSVRRHCAAES